MRPIYIVLIVIVAVVLGFCALGVDDDDEAGWGFVGMATVVAGDDGDKRDENRNRNGNDCNRARAQCSDDDFSPSFDKSPVEDSFNPTICLPFSRCEGSDEPG